MAHIHRRRFSVEGAISPNRFSRPPHDTSTRLVLEHRGTLIWAVALFPLLFVLITVTVKLFTP